MLLIFWYISVGMVVFEIIAVISITVYLCKYKKEKEDAVSNMEKRMKLIQQDELAESKRISIEDVDD